MQPQNRVLPLLYEQFRAGIRNEVDGLARRLKPWFVFMTETRLRGCSEGEKINEEKNNKRNSNFPGFGFFLAGTGTRRKLPKPLPGKICPM
jgi:hypothetical protein